MSYKEIGGFLLSNGQLQFFNMVRDRLHALVELDSANAASLELKLDENSGKLAELIRDPEGLKAYNLVIASAGVIVE